MTAFDVFNLIGGLSLFLFGMMLMSDTLERRAGNRLKVLLGRLTDNRFAGLLTGLGVTAVIQSSSATTVMVVGFVNSGLMTLKQSINVIMGANIGTTVTAWILSLAGINSDNFFLNLLKPTSFTPILALIGIILFMLYKDIKKRELGVVLLSFSLLMFGMEVMSSAVSGLKDVPEFRNAFLAFSNPVLGVLIGAFLTAVIQSSSASVGILQALASTGTVTYGAAIPIIMGQNIGTCITAMISSIGANKNAKRAALVHLSFNVIGSMAWVAMFMIVKEAFDPILLHKNASLVGIAFFHSVFNILCTVLLFPFGGFLERLVTKLIPDASIAEPVTELDDRFLGTPALALLQTKQVLEQMAKYAITAMKESIETVKTYDPERAERIRLAEEETDKLEDMLGTYLLKIASLQLSQKESIQATLYMRIIGDYERIGDHAVNILESVEEKRDSETRISDIAMEDYYNISNAVIEILDLSYQAFSGNSLECARKTEPLEQVIDCLKEELKLRHIHRLQKGKCSVEAGFIWMDILTNLERVADHCSNISGSVLDAAGSNLNIHENQRLLRSTDEDFQLSLLEYKRRYLEA